MKRFNTTEWKPWKRKLLSRKHNPPQYRRYEMIVRPAPLYIRPYSDKVVYPGYAFLIRVENTRRKPKRLNIKHAKKMARK